MFVFLLKTFLRFSTWVLICFWKWLFQWSQKFKNKFRSIDTDFGCKNNRKIILNPSEINRNRLIICNEWFAMFVDALTYVIRWLLEWLVELACPVVRIISCLYDATAIWWSMDPCNIGRIFCKVYTSWWHLYPRLFLSLCYQRCLVFYCGIHFRRDAPFVPFEPKLA